MIINAENGNKTDKKTEVERDNQASGFDTEETKEDVSDELDRLLSLCIEQLSNSDAKGSTNDNDKDDVDNNNDVVHNDDVEHNDDVVHNNGNDSWYSDNGRYDDCDDEQEETESDFSTHHCRNNVILQSNYKSNKDYCDAVVHSIKEILCEHGVKVKPRIIRDEMKVLGFYESISGIDVDCHIVVNYDNCIYRIGYNLNFENLPGRTPLIDHFCQDKNYGLRYGSVIMDHMDNEKRIEYSSCFCGAFSEESFYRYWEFLSYTLIAYAEEYKFVATSRVLNNDLYKIIAELINGLADDLPEDVKKENKATYDRVCETFGNKLNRNGKRLVNFIIEHNNK